MKLPDQTGSKNMDPSSKLAKLFGLQLLSNSIKRKVTGGQKATEAIDKENTMI